MSKESTENIYVREIQQLKAGLGRCFEAMLQYHDPSECNHLRQGLNMQMRKEPMHELLSDPLGLAAYEEAQQLRADNQELKDILDGKDVEISKLKTILHVREQEKEVLQKRVDEIDAEECEVITAYETCRFEKEALEKRVKELEDYSKYWGLDVLERKIKEFELLLNPANLTVF